ncbi:hypothetical protein [Nonomuraea sp. NPDC049400]|uniref:hypothetical protein n=1 Tax=Nonomuraea sp. NPDC049400 TaxID=3364352 RepID=UPI0037B2AF7D
MGISTAFTGGGKYEPEDNRFQILYKFRSRSASNCAIDSSGLDGVVVADFDHDGVQEHRRRAGDFLAVEVDAKVVAGEPSMPERTA